MEETDERSRQAANQGKRRIPRSLSFWIGLLTFLMLFGLLFTGAVIAIVRLIGMITG
jgi:hypothetical protein